MNILQGGKMMSGEIWRDDGYEEQFASAAAIAEAGFRTVAVDEITAYYGNMSSNFQMRHVIGPEGQKGFLFFANITRIRVGDFFLGTTMEIYREASQWGQAEAEEQLRLHVISLESRR